MRTTGVLLAIALLLTGCSGADDTTATASEDETSTSSVPENGDADEQASADCEPVSKAMAKGIASGREDGTGLKGGRAVAVKSPDFSKVYFIAMEFKAPCIGTEAGVWASNSLKPGGGLTMAVDGMAQEFTVWPDADSTNANISKADASVDAALSCLS